MWVNKNLRVRLALSSVAFFLIGFFTSQPQFPPAWMIPSASQNSQVKTAHEIVAYAEANQIQPDQELREALNQLQTSAGLTPQVSESVRDLIAQMDAELVPGDAKFQSLVKEFESQQQKIR